METDPDSEIGDNTDYFIDRETTCFLCLKSVVSSQVNCDEYNKEKFSLRKICHYLGIYLKENLTFDIVPLCQNCLVVASKLKDICAELELLQMKVNQCLQSFSGAFKKSYGVPNEGGDEDNVDENEWLERENYKWLREEIKQKCDQKLGTVHPKVVIQSEVKRQESEPTVSGNAANACQICHEKVTGESTKHQINHHPEVLLSSYKIEENLPLSQFKLYIDHVFHDEKINSEKHYDRDNEIPTVECQYCPNNYKGHDRLIHHLFKIHKEILGTKLQALQKDTSIQQLQQIILPHVESWKCAKCGKGFDSKNELHQHKKINCGTKLSPPPKKRPRKSISNLKEVPETLDPLEPSPKNDDDYTCYQCNPPHTLGNRKVLNRHRVNLHVETFFERSRQTHMTPEDFKIYCEHVVQLDLLGSEKFSDDKGRPCIKCQTCKRLLTNQYSSRYHIVFQHQDILAKKIVELQENMTPEEISAIKLPVFSFEKDQRYTCDECGVAFKHNTSLSRHKKHYCGKEAQPSGVLEQTVLTTESPGLSQPTEEWMGHVVVPKMEVDEMMEILPNDGL